MKTAKDFIFNTNIETKTTIDITASNGSFFEFKPTSTSNSINDIFSTPSGGTFLFGSYLYELQERQFYDKVKRLLEK